MSDFLKDVGEAPDICHLFLDEAGVPDIFDKKGVSKIGTNGVSRYFMLGMLEVDDPDELSRALNALRFALCSDPYFSSAPSIQPAARKTALLFHAKDDLPDVRVKVFDLLRGFGDALHFRAVVCDKEVIRTREESRRIADPKARYQPDALYDELAGALFGRFSRMADHFVLRVAKRGQKDRNHALLEALRHGEAEIEKRLGVSRGGPEKWESIITNPAETVCLQAADYYLWALQRFYEPRVHIETGEIVHEVRYLDAVRHQISQVHDLHHGSPGGTYFVKDRPLTIESRFPGPVEKRKRPRV